MQPREFNCYFLIDGCLKIWSLAREVFYFSVFFKKWKQLRFLRTTFCLSSWKWLIPKFFDNKKLCRKTFEVTCNKMFFGLLSSHKYALNRALTQMTKQGEFKKKKYWRELSKICIWYTFKQLGNFAKGSCEYSLRYDVLHTFTKLLRVITKLWSDFQEISRQLQAILLTYVSIFAKVTKLS